MRRTEILWRKFENEICGVGEMAQSDALRLSKYVLSREIGRRMSTGDIRFTASNWAIKTLKWQLNSLNGTFMQY